MKNFVRISTIEEVHKMLGIKKPKHPMVSMIPVTDDVVNFDYGDVTYILDFYQISLKENLTGSFLYGRNQYDFSEGTMIFTQPGQTIQMSENERVENAKGYILLFHPDLIRQSSLMEEISTYPFFKYDANEALHLSEEERDHVYSLLDKIAEEYERSIDTHTQEIIIGSISMLLKYAQRYYDRQFFTRKNVNQDVLGRFEKLLQNTFDSNETLERGIPSIKELGDKMGMSSHYLSELLKKETGQSAKSHLQSHIIEKAKNLLLSTNSSISEVAYILGFEYPQHFSKLFKLKTGFSPKEYRKIS
ncbi:MAG: helix-turn-helix domain-containing protein [Chitinophagales bacterium]